MLVFISKKVHLSVFRRLNEKLNSIIAHSNLSNEFRKLNGITMKSAELVQGAVRCHSLLSIEKKL